MVPFPRLSVGLETKHNLIVTLILTHPNDRSFPSNPDIKLFLTIFSYLHANFVGRSIGCWLLRACNLWQSALFAHFCPFLSSHFQSKNFLNVFYIKLFALFVDRTASYGSTNKLASWYTASLPGAKSINQQTINQQTISSCTLIWDLLKNQLSKVVWSYKQRPTNQCWTDGPTNKTAYSCMHATK